MALLHAISNFTFECVRREVFFYLSNIVSDFIGLLFSTKYCDKQI